jgi:hypothetical protein
MRTLLIVVVVLVVLAVVALVRRSRSSANDLQRVREQVQEHRGREAQQLPERAHRLDPGDPQGDGRFG